MALPAAPITRIEEYLEAIAKGITLSGNVSAEDFMDLVEEIKSLEEENKNRVTSLTETILASETIEAVHAPVYIENLSSYADYGLSEPGWYVFARIAAKGDTVVTPSTAVEGAAGYIASIGEDHVDVAVRFEVASESVPVTIDWDGINQERFVFKATDLAIRNLDYLVTYYVYDIENEGYVTWEYTPATEETFDASKHYWIKDGDTYTEAEVTAGDTIPDGYYVHSMITFEGMTRNISYVLNTEVDCPMTFVLPDIDNDTHGCWFDITILCAGAYSMTLIPPEGVKVATEHTQQEQKGINRINLQYSSAAGTKIWRFMNTRSTVPE